MLGVLITTLMCVGGAFLCLGLFRRTSSSGALFYLMWGFLLLLVGLFFLVFVA